MDTFNRGGVDPAQRFLSRECEMYSAPGWPGQPYYRGFDGAKALAAEWTDNFEDYQWVPDRSIDVGPDRAVLLGHHGGRTRTGVPIEGKVAGVFSIEDGLIREIRFFFQWEDACEAAGLDASAVRSPGS